MSKFEKVSKFAEVDINLPVRKTAESAGYDMEVAEDIVIPSYSKMARMMGEVISPFIATDEGITTRILTLEEMAAITKTFGTKPTLVSTGMKCQLDPGTYLELSVRSSCPLKHWLVMANSVGIIDADYYNNPDNEGEIFFQMINLSPFDILLKKGDIVGQGIIKPYLTTEDDNASGQRTGGFGSTSV
jgi:dUTP pyrophosphatase